MGHEKYLLLFASLACGLIITDGCQMQGISNWLLTIEVDILDVHEGVFFNRSTTDILNIIEPITSGVSVDANRYLNVELEDSQFIISTKTEFANYEENETSEVISFGVNFQCAGTTNSLFFEVLIQDTNNNAPIFRPSDEYEFTITPPLPPGFQITGCIGDDIIVRDIDLTTERINFTIEENPYFEISYSGRSPTSQKEFIGVLTTKTLIRSLPDPVDLTIYATDVDRTGDPPITTTGKIRIKADDEFQFPDEPVFSNPYYLATYTNDNQLEIQDRITLQQGYDGEVVFSLDGEHKDYFSLDSDENLVIISVSRSLPNDILRSGRVLLVVRADREHTSGGTATLIVQLPEVPGLEFSQNQYQGRIVDNELETIQLTLTQGYQDNFNVQLLNDLHTYFTTNIEDNVITLSMSPLNSTVINTNNFITLQVVASNEYSSATAVVTLDIIKDDNVTPVFENVFYSGSYDAETGLTIAQIVLIQGYDNTVSFSLEGDYKDYFEISNDESTVTLTTSGISPELWSEQQLLLTVEATKPRSVTAAAAISIRLPLARELAFQSSLYTGTLQNNNVTHSAIVLSKGYTDDVNFTLSGDLENYFSISNDENVVTINLSRELPESVILEHNFLTLTLRASGYHAIPTSTAVVLDIIKQDVTTPVFTERIYRATYIGSNSLNIGTIGLVQGYDDTVTFTLYGEHEEYFKITGVGNELSLEIQKDIPPDVIFSEKVLLFNILADKPITVGANAAISIAFPQELTDAAELAFSQNTYVGSLENYQLSLENIILETGYEFGTTFNLTGDLLSYFELQYTGNNISISTTDNIPEELIDDKKFIVLEIKASRERAISTVSSIVIDIVRNEIVPPVFQEAYYRGVYANEDLQFEHVISLYQGFDDSVHFVLQGESAIWFSISQANNSVFLLLNSTIPEEVLENNNQLLFTVEAIKPGTITATATIAIDLPQEIPETVIMRFTQTSYVGRIENGLLDAPTITIIGDREPIQLNLTGEFKHYFKVSYDSETNNVLLQLTQDLPEEIIDEYSFILLDLEVSYPEAINGYTAIVLELVKQPSIPIPVFEHAYYIGEYSQLNGLQLGQSIQLIHGFDESVKFTLSGEDSKWFDLLHNDDNNLTLTIIDNGLGQIFDRNYLLFSVLAGASGGITGQTAVVINLTDLTTGVPLRFDENYHKGSIENDNLNLANIYLAEGYSLDMNVSFTGGYKEYFNLTQQENVFSLELLSNLPADITESNNVLVFTLEVQVADTRAHTTIILEIVKSNPVSVAFEEAYYVGSYFLINGFTFDPQIKLREHDGPVSFTLDGVDSQWFGVVEMDDFVTIEQVNPIPVEVLSNRSQLIFVVIGRGANNETAASTIIISMVDDSTIINFERNIYLGTIQNKDINIETIVVSNGYSEEIAFTLFGDLRAYFNVTSEENQVTLTLNSIIPDEKLPENGVISLELQASAPQAISAYATIALSIFNELLTFDATYYTGSYTIAGGLEFPDLVILTEGYDDDVIFFLDGDSSIYFDTVVLNNTVSLSLISPIPQAIVNNEQQLIFTIHADKPGAMSAVGTIVISLIDDVTEKVILGFDQISYIGSIEKESVYLEPIILSVGYSENVSFGLHGELSRYFDHTSTNGSVNIFLKDPISEESLPDNGIVVLEIIATAPDAISAYATIVLHFEIEDLNNLLFNQPYYVGTYTEENQLIFKDEIILLEGYDETVVFELDGDDSQYFEIEVVSSNSRSLRMLSPIPSAVIANNQQLIFTVRAESTGAAMTRATIVISLLDEFTEDPVLGFDRVAYVGTINDSSIDIGPITLSEGYSSDVSFSLFGELRSYFNLSNAEEVVTITLDSPIPEDLIPENRLIILTLQASVTNTMAAHATIVFEVIIHDPTTALDQLEFSKPYYTGYYTERDSLAFEEVITLTEGYNEDVQFYLEGDDSHYFEIEVVSSNLRSLRMLSPIPSAVIANNQQLIFTVRAERTGAAMTRATIVISLLDEFIEDPVLGFDRVAYVGTINDSSIDIGPITLSEGYSSDVSFSLFGELRSYFNLSNAEEVVTITLDSPIPEDLIPENRLIILTLQASVTNTMAAHATIVFEVIIHDPTTALDQLEFSKPYYTGYYTERDSLAFEEVITLTEGYNEDVQFYLEGDDSHYFEIEVVSSNSRSLRILSPIPSAVIANNQQLIFTVRAERTGAAMTRATIVISLLDEFIEDPVLGFDRVAYVGTINDSSIDIGPITLSEGYSSDVSFSLFGELRSYFNLSNAEEVVTITLDSPIPEDLIPENRLIILTLQASVTNTMAAHATIVFEVIIHDPTTALDQLEFSKPYYTGYYTERDSLAFEEVITLTEGYNEDVQFYLEGDDSHYFEIEVVSSNSRSLRMLSPIPSAVIANNQQLIFTVRAERTGAAMTRATIVISLLDEFIEDPVLGFDRVAYVGTINDSSIDIGPITLSEGYSSDVSFSLFGELRSYFNLSNAEEVVTITLDSPIPEDLIPENRLIILTLQASVTNTMAAHATIVFEVIIHDPTTALDQLEFSKPYYTGYYTERDSLAFEEVITLTEGYNEDVQFYLEGDDSHYFEIEVVSSNLRSLRMLSPIPSAVIANNQQLIFTVRAERTGAAMTRATIVISLLDEFIEDPVLGFDRVAYVGTINDSSIDIGPITLSEGYSSDVSFSLFGELRSYFNLSNAEEVVTITLDSPIPEDLIPENRLIILTLQASVTNTMAAHATIVFEVIIHDPTTALDQLEFSKPYYTGYYTERDSLAFEEVITLTEGYNEDVQFYLEGDDSHYFEIEVVSSNSRSLRMLSPIPSAVIANNQQLIFTVRAERTGAAMTRATIVISLLDEFIEDPVLGFDRVAYVGTINDSSIDIGPITLSEGYSSDVSFSLFGELRSYFNLSNTEEAVTITLDSPIPGDLIPENRLIILTLQASITNTMAAHATIIFEVILDDPTTALDLLVFSQNYYTGFLDADGLTFEEKISLVEGFDQNVVFTLEGDSSLHFQVDVIADNEISLKINSSNPPDVILNKHSLIFVILAERKGAITARATIVIALFDEDCSPADGARFDSVLYQGILDGGVVMHDKITLYGFTGSAVEILGDYQDLFTASLENGQVKVTANSQALSNDITFIPLELRAGSARAVLLLDVSHAEEPSLPLVSFSATSYVFRVEITQTGLIGAVSATADNGERLTYTLNIEDNAHLQQRLFINNEGELRLFAPVNTGVYRFDVVATTVFSQATAMAPVSMTVDIITTCGEDDFHLPPLLILDRDEESSHMDLVTLNRTHYIGCRYELSNRWPSSQSWLYVDENGLHTTDIDREDESIAFMALSQVQVELSLVCDRDNDATTRSKRSLNDASRLDHLGPYDYGDKNWILTDSILYEPRRTLVNLIVNDINDNDPIFIGKENEPIVVGYPIADLEERILPRALIVVQATDADVGINAALVYRSTEDFLAVSPYTGFVHVRDKAALLNNTIFRVIATDRNGEGNSGHLDILVRLIDTNHIAVVTIQNAFLEDENAILANLSSAVGYEVKALRTTVLSDVEIDLGERRKKRQSSISTGSSLQLFIYGLYELYPVDVQQLAEDVSNSNVTALIIADTVTLEDYLESLGACPLPGRDTGLLIATIILSVLLFILIVAAAVWFFLKWRAERKKYEQFSDEYSVESRNESVTVAKALDDSAPKPRINLEDLKRSEKRLQEMLEAPVEETSVKTVPVSVHTPAESKIMIPEMPIVIQSIDKLKDVDESDSEDEFGERLKGKRKSVVTFNENVEKIIHVEDTPDEGELEVYKL